MNSARLLARVASRQTVRPSYTHVRAIQFPRLTSSWRFPTSIASRPAASFSTSTPRLQGSEELAAKLEQELSYERDVNKDHDEPGALKEYLQSSDFQLEDNPGSEEVHLVRTYGDEQIKVTFSTESLSNPEPDAESADPALYDEDIEGRQGGKQGAEDQAEGEQYAQEPTALSIAVNVQIVRQGKGAISLACYLDQEGRFVIDHVAYFPTQEMAEGKSAEDELSKRGLYTGPPFDELDEGLQTIFEDYIKERGIDDGMAAFIPQYIDQKETQEYMKWMENIKRFVE